MKYTEKNKFLKRLINHTTILHENERGQHYYKIYFLKTSYLEYYYVMNFKYFIFELNCIFKYDLNIVPGLFLV